MISEKSSQLVEIITTIICVHMLYGKKFVMNFPAVMVVGIDLIVYEVIIKHGLSDYSNIAVYITLIFYSAWMFECSGKELIINTVLLAVNIGFLQIIAMLSMVYIFAEAGMPADISLICNLIVLLLTVLVDKFIGYANIKRRVLSQKGVTIVIASICMISIVYGFFSIRITGTMSAIFFICVVIVCSIVCIVCFQWLRQKELRKEKEIDFQLHELYYDSFQTLLKELRARQHDFKNHIQTIRNQHYVCRDYETLVQAQRTYCDEVLRDDKYAGLLGCKNSIIAGFLYGKFVEIEKNGTSVKYEVAVFSQKYTIPLYVIIETLGILLDNAAEYVMGRESSYIEMQIYESAENLLIKVTNPIEGMSMADFMSYFEPDKSTKGQGRGIGLTKIKQYSEKYEWKIIVHMEDKDDKNHLVIEIKIPLGQQVGSVI